MEAYIESLIRFGPARSKLLTYVPEPVPIHLWLDHTITTSIRPNDLFQQWVNW